KKQNKKPPWGVSGFFVFGFKKRLAICWSFLRFQRSCNRVFSYLDTYRNTVILKKWNESSNIKGLKVF
ncbi:hypothetical protein, partial [Bacillus altitudinis]|uniref:hypothetical protein n=1 Tax=Bacillus altitudinis TaxID=293387 RepID=UPI001A9E8685